MIRRSERTADIVLVGAGLVFLVSYPFKAHIWGGLVMHIAGAAFVGGLADWYAVTALFAKPLGISFRTEILPRSKGRIVETVREMVTRELLTAGHVYRVIKDEKVASKLIRAAVQEIEAGRVRSMAHRIGADIAKRIDVNEVATDVLHAVLSGAKSWKLTPVLCALLKRIVEDDTADVLWRHVNRSMRRIIGGSELRPYICGVLEAVAERYAEDSVLRKIIVLVAGTVSSTEETAERIQEGIVAYLKTQESIHSPLGERVRAAVNGLRLKLERDEAWQASVEAYKNEMLAELFEGEEFRPERLLSEKRRLQLLAFAETELQRYAEAMSTDEKRAEALERMLHGLAVRALRKLRLKVADEVTAGVERYSAAELSEAVRSKIGHDLQMIRINGACIGGILGSAFYLLHLLVREVRIW